MALQDISVAHLFEPLDQQLITLLHQLSPSDWHKPTVAGSWTVKEVVAHLLDGNIRALSIQRDRYFGEQAPELSEYTELVAWLNQLNKGWVNAMRRVSPSVLIALHQFTGPMTSAYFSRLAPYEEAVFAVDWAGESKSYNWMHQAREYTEKWHHQQQIRDAVGHEGIMTIQFFPPFIATYMRGLPNTFKNITSPDGTIIKVVVTSVLGGCWWLIRQEGRWLLTDEVQPTPTAEVHIAPEIAWKLFSKNTRPELIRDKVTLIGDQHLAAHVLEMVSVMA